MRFCDLTEKEVTANALEMSMILILTNVMEGYGR